MWSERRERLSSAAFQYKYLVVPASVERALVANATGYLLVRMKMLTAFTTFVKKDRRRRRGHKKRTTNHTKNV